MTIIEKQYGYITDLLCVGEIEGLVGGYSGVFLNETSIVGNFKYNELRGRSGKCTAIGSGISDANGLFSDVNLDDGPRYMQIFSAGPSSTISGTLVKGSSDITTAGSFFLDKHSLNFTGTGQVDPTDYIKFIVRIPGAGLDGGDYAGIVIGNSSDTQATLYPPTSTEVASGTSISVDEVIKIASISDNNSCTLESAVAVNVVLSNCRLSPAVQFPGSLNPSITYDDTYAVVQRGSRNQLPITSFTRGRSGAPSASVIIGRNDDLQRSSLAGGSQSPIKISGDSFSFSQYSKTEIDAIKVAIEFPGGLRHNGREGESRNAYVEFQIIINYTTLVGGSLTEQSRLIYGKDYGGATFSNTIPSWPTAVINGESTLINYAHNNYAYGSPRNSTGVVTKKSANSSFIKEFFIDLEKFKPFQDWEIEIRRLSPEALGEYCPEDNTWIGAARLKNIQALVYDKFSYPGTALGMVSFSAEDFETPPKRAYHLRGKKIKVPTNYFTREELGSSSAQYTRVKGTGLDSGSYQTWDGSFRGDSSLVPTDLNFPKVYCNNPAWVFYDIITNKEYGLGEFINEDEVDKYALYQIARYCDELVTDGKGNSEPRFSCNVYLQKQEEAYKVLKDLSSVFRGMMYWIDGNITAVQDRPKEPSYTFNSSNVKDGLFNYTYTGSRSRVNQVNVLWNNPEEFYKKTIVTIEDTANIATTGKINKKDLVAFGCTSESQARRLGKWHLATLLNETEVVSFSTGMNAAFLTPGEIINIQDKDSSGIEVSGRTAAGSTTNVINLDRVLESGYPGGDPADCVLYLIYAEPGIFLAQDSANINGQSYTRGALLLEDNSGTPISTIEDSINLLDDTGDPVITTYSKNTRVEVKDINGPLSALNQVTVIGAFSSAPPIDVVWAIGRKQDTTTEELKEYRIFGIKQDNTSEYSITASSYYPEKFDEIDVDPPVYTTDYIPTSGRLDSVPGPASISVEMIPEARSSDKANPTGQRVIISWDTPEESYKDSLGVTTLIPYRFLSSFEVQHNFEEVAGLSTFKTEKVPGTSTSISISGVSEGFYTVRVRTVNDLGIKSPWTIVRRFVSLSSAGNARINSIAVGGVLSGDSFRLISTTGKVLLSSVPFSYTSPSGEIFSYSTIPAGSPDNAFLIEADFSPMGNDETAYLYFDASGAEEATPNPWREVQIYTDGVVRDSNGNLLNRPYIVPVGYTGTGLGTTTGVIDTSSGSNTLVGTGTLFTSEYAVGDLLKTSSNPDADIETQEAEYRVIASIESDTLLTVTTPFLKNLVSGYTFVQDFKPDVSRDAILAKIETDNTGVYSAQFYINGLGPQGADGQNIGIVVTDASIVYDGEGLNPSYEPSTSDPSAIGIETRTSTTSSPEYKYTLNGSSVTFPEFTTNPFYNYTVPTTWTQGADIVRVQVRRAGSTVIELEDSISIVRVKQGSGNLAGVLTNPTHTVNTDAGGRTFESNFPNGSGQWELFFSGDDVTNIGTYSVVGGTSAAGKSSKTQNGLTFQVDESTGEYTLLQLDAPTKYNLAATVGGSSQSNSVTPSATLLEEGDSVSFSVSGAASSTVYLQFVYLTANGTDFTSTPPSSSSREAIVLDGAGAGTSLTYTTAIDFDTANEVFYAEIYSSASGGSLLATSNNITIQKQTYNFSVSSTSLNNNDTLTIHIETNNTNVSTLYLSFDNPSAGLGTGDFTNPNVGSVAPISARQAITLSSQQFDYTIDVFPDNDAAETFVPAIYGASSGGSPLSSLPTVTLVDTSLSGATAQWAGSTSFAASSDSENGGKQAASISLYFYRDGDAEVVYFGDFLTGSIDVDDWLPVSDRTSTIGDQYEIKWDKISGVVSANFAEDTWVPLNLTRVISGPTVVAYEEEPELLTGVVNVQIRKLSAGSPDFSVNITLQAAVAI